MTGLSRIWLTCKKGFDLGFIFSAYPARKLFFHRNLKVPKAFFSHLHKVLWMFFCCFFLAACSGGSDSGSSRSNSGSDVPERDAEEEECSVENGVAEFREGKCIIVACNLGYYKPAEGDTCIEGKEKRYKPCHIESGTGHQTWISKQRVWSEKCQLIACDAGYDDHDNDNDCEKTIAGYYSPAGSSDRIACSTPDDATADTISTGLSSANECWTCNAGYDDHNNTGACSVTDATYYSPAESSDRIACSTPDDATANTISTGLSSANECWTCNAGYDDHNNTGACSVTDATYYSPAESSDRIACSTPDDATADTISTGLSSANECWTCNAGYDDHNNTGACSVTDATYYSPAESSDRIACSTPDDATADTISTGLSSANECWTVQCRI